MQDWREIPEFSEYEINPDGQVRNKTTGQVKKPAKNKYGRLEYMLWSENKRSKRSKDALLKDVYGIEMVYKTKTNNECVKSCENCNWRFGNKCSVVQPGLQSEIELSGVCSKWEREVMWDKDQDQTEIPDRDFMLAVSEEDTMKQWIFQEYN